MPARPVLRSDLEQRWHEFARTSYLTSFSVMKGVVAGIAAFVLLQLLVTATLTFATLDRFLLWTAALLGMVMTYQANSTGTVMMFWTPTWKDALPAFLVGIIEFLLFALLAPEQNQPFRSVDYHASWYFVFALYALIGGGLAGHVSQQVRRVEYGETDIAKLMLGYSGRQKSIFLFAMGFFVFWLIVSILIGVLNELKWLLSLLSCFAVLNMWFVLRQQEKDLAATREILDYKMYVKKPVSNSAP